MKDINLMPREYIIKEKQKRLHILFLALGCSILALVITGVMTPYKMIDDRTKALKELNLQVSDSKYEATKQVKQQLLQKQAELSMVQEFLKEMEKESMISRTTLDLLTGFLSPKMYIQKLDADNKEKTIKIEGNADKAENVSEYVVHLSNLPFVEKIDMKTSTEEVEPNEEHPLRERLDTLKVVKYELTLQMENREGEADTDETQDK